MEILKSIFKNIIVILFLSYFIVLIFSAIVGVAMVGDTIIEEYLITIGIIIILKIGIFLYKKFIHFV